MLRVDGYYLYQVASQLRPLAQMAWARDGERGTTYDAASMWVYVAEGALGPLLSTSVFQLKTSRAAGERLLKAVREVKTKCFQDSNRNVEIPWRDVHEITSSLEAFETVLNAELALMPLYVVTPKAGYDTAILVDAGSRCFPNDLAAKAPEAISDIQQATRCLAFELFTAAGFHFHRANESVLRKYWDAVSNNQPRPRSRNMGDYLNALDTAQVGDVRTKASLRDLKDMHRNPLVHPEHSIENLDEAIALMNGVHGAIARMLTEIPAPSGISGGLLAGGVAGP